MIHGNEKKFGSGALHGQILDSVIENKGEGVFFLFPASATIEGAILIPFITLPVKTNLY